MAATKTRCHQACLRIVTALLLHKWDSSKKPLSPPLWSFPPAATEEGVTRSITRARGSRVWAQEVRNLWAAIIRALNAGNSAAAWTCAIKDETNIPWRRPVLCCLEAVLGACLRPGCAHLYRGTGPVFRSPLLSKTHTSDVQEQAGSHCILPMVKICRDFAYPFTFITPHRVHGWVIPPAADPSFYRKCRPGKTDCHTGQTRRGHDTQPLWHTVWL